MISTSPHKEKEARERLGADNFIVSKNQEQMAVRALRVGRLRVWLHSGVMFPTAFLAHVRC